jgi:hypothetical protein
VLTSSLVLVPKRTVSSGQAPTSTILFDGKALQLNEKGAKEEVTECRNKSEMEPKLGSFILTLSHSQTVALSQSHLLTLSPSHTPEYSQTFTHTHTHTHTAS